MKHSRLAALVIVALAIAPLDAKDASIAGTWTLSFEQFGFRLVLEQEKAAVTGTLDWPHGDPIKLTGVFADDTLMFVGETAGENFTLHVSSTSSLKPDDTLAGTLQAHFDEFNDAHEVVRVRSQTIPWTARRGLHDVVHFPR